MDVIIDRFRRNYRDFWQMHQWHLAIFFIAIFCDAVSTTVFMLRLGTENELHPGVLLASQVLGPVLGPWVSALIKGLSGVIVAVYWRRIAFVFLMTAAAISFWAAWYNVWGCQHYIPPFFGLLGY